MKSLNYKKICVITGGRADYGILKDLIKKIKFHSKLKLQLIATGSHLSSAYGKTISEIYNDRLQTYIKIKILSKATNPSDLIKNSTNALSGYAKAFKKLNPDIVLVLGDRYEIFCAAYTAVIFGIPVAHFHGGEITLNSYDEFFRHSISKLSQIHFVSTLSHKKRVIQLGELPKNVFNVGSLSLENISKLNLLDNKTLEKKLNIKFKNKSLMVTIHPETLNRKKINYQISTVLKALKNLKNTTLILTQPNNDIGSNEIEKQIKIFCKNNKNAFFFNSLGRTLYLSCVKKVDAVLGNSSSGIIEVPSFHTPSIDIGKRQYGRERARSVISCDFNKLKILNSIKKAYSKNFLNNLNNFQNPYYKKNTSKMILKIIRKIKLNKISSKQFYDVKFSSY